jgi:Xaa-Pro aminopeptidase
MKSDLHRIMSEKGYAALLITGPAQHNAPMVYLTGGGHMTNADLILPRGGEATLFYNPMERDEAAASGLRTRNLAEYNWKDLLAEAGGDSIQAMALRYKRMLVDCGVTAGKIAVYGVSEIGSTYAVLTALQALMPDVEIVGEPARTSSMLEARATKDEDEVARVRKMGAITTAVVGQVADFLSAHPAQNGVLVKKDGGPLTIGDVKSKINLWLAEKGVENPHGTIFSIGRDAGVPHSTGNLSDPMALGKTIIFDIYPCEAGGGYHYDFTRTWCLGYAPDEAQKLYEDVLSVYNQITDELEVNAPYKAYQQRTCELFEGMGHPTVKSTPNTQDGYVHSLGHGVGLNIHERPWSGISAGEADRLAPGAVFTIEPGLYYPGRGLGVRLENTLWVNPDGGFEIMADYPMDLVLPVR